MTTYLCPKGHPSETDDFCDTCGAKIASVSGATDSGGAGSGGAGSGATGSGGAGSGGTGSGSGATGSGGTGSVPGPGTGSACPHCGAPRVGTGRFCEDCGFDHSTGKAPAVDPPVSAAPAATAGWTATIAVDREYFEENAIEGVEFPAATPARTVTLPPPQVRIGRASTSKGTRPEIDLADTDPGVSHSHALLTLTVDGVWLVSDQGSTNGTYLNDGQQPLPAGETRPLKAGDEVHVGAWTTITLHGPAA